VTQLDVLKHWADRWRSLRAWRAPIAMQLTFKLQRKNSSRAGTAWSHQGRAVVYLTGDLAYDLATALHELAHLAAPDSEHHGTHWRTLFVAAAVEACGGSADDYEIDDVEYGELDAQVEDTVRTWLKQTGQAAILGAIGVAS
jgi:RES domain-containing protein